MFHPTTHLYDSCLCTSLVHVEVNEMLKYNEQLSEMFVINLLQLAALCYTEHNIYSDFFIYSGFLRTTWAIAAAPTKASRPF